MKAFHASQGLASTDHTTLLLNCYTKLKDIDKLDKFLRAGGSTEDKPTQFDVDTAIKVALLCLMPHLHSQDYQFCIQIAIPIQQSRSIG